MKQSHSCCYGQVTAWIFSFEYLRTLLKCTADTLVYDGFRWVVSAAVDSAIGSWRGLLTHITSESKTRHSQSMTNFPLNANSEYSVN
jgi:hypothetical protein